MLISLPRQLVIAPQEKTRPSVVKRNEFSFEKAICATKFSGGFSVNSYILLNLSLEQLVYRYNVVRKITKLNLK